MLKEIRIKISQLMKNISAHPGKWAIVFLFSLLLLSIIGLIILAYSCALDEKSFGREIGKTLLQIIAVSVIGVAVSWLLKEHQNIKEKALQNEERERKLRENRNQLRKEMLHKLNEIYFAVKSARRIMRVKLFTTNYINAIHGNNTTINQAVYDNHLENINIRQLELETIKKELQSDKSLFTDFKKMDDCINKMEKYLNSLVGEYEKKRVNVSATSLHLIKDEFPELTGLLQSARDNSPFRKGFIEPFHITVEAIWTELITKSKTIEQSRISTSTIEANKLKVKFFFDDVCNGKNLKAIKEIFAKEVSFNGNPGTHEDVIKYVEEIQDAFTDAHVEINKQLAEEDRVSTMRTWTGTQVKKYRNHPPTNKLMEWTEISVVRLEDEKIMEDWVVRSELIEKN